MRVIAGKARRLNLKTVPGMDTRPTTDRIKETLFNMIQTDIADARFLDLFSGSGAIGIEALSRGAAFAVFIENNKKAVDCIRENLKFTKLESQARVLHMDVLHGLKALEYDLPFDCIFMDPPYNNDLEKNVLNYLKDSAIITKDTLIIVEASLDTDFSYVESMGFQIWKRKVYKTNVHVFLCRK